MIKTPPIRGTQKAMRRLTSITIATTATMIRRSHGSATATIRPTAIMSELQSLAPHESPAIARKKPKNDMIAASTPASTSRTIVTTRSHVRIGRFPGGGATA